MKKTTYFVLIIFILFSLMHCKQNSFAKQAKETTITINATGDCTFGSDISSPASVNFYAIKRKVKNLNYFFKKVSPIFKKDDLTIVNFEGTLTNRGYRVQKKFAFKGSPSYINILKKGGVEAVSFANNHCRDYGNISYTDTISTFKKSNIKYASYQTTATYKTKDTLIGMVAVNGLDNIVTSKKLIYRGIKKLKKKKANIIIVSIHAGTEHTNKVNSTQKVLAHYAIDHGANLILGHHPHVLQGIEKYKGAYIVYSLGNFCFGGNTNPQDKDTFIFSQKFTLKNGKIVKKLSSAKVIPCSISSKPNINNYQPKPANNKRYNRIIKRLVQYSKTFKTYFKMKNRKYTNILK